MPIVADAFGGAEGLLGTDGLADKRIHIDFRKDFIEIARSRNKRAEFGFIAIPLRKDAGRLLVIRAKVAGVEARAIIDTGAQSTIANEALRSAIARRYTRKPPTRDEIVGATGQMQLGDGFPLSPITIGSIEIHDAHVTFGDMHIFSHWKFTEQPAVLIGMDVLGLLDTLIIDYKRQELQVKAISLRPVAPGYQLTGPARCRTCT